MPAPRVAWQVDRGPHFANQIAALLLEGRRSVVRWERAAPLGADEPLELLFEERLA